MADVNILQGHLTQAEFDASPTYVLGDGQIVWLKDNSGLFKKGDSVTQLSALPFLGGGGSQTLQQTLINGNVIENGTSINSEDGNTQLYVNDGSFEALVTDGDDVINSVNANLAKAGISSEDGTNASSVTSYPNRNEINSDVQNTFDAPNNNFPQETPSKLAVFDASRNLKSGSISEDDIQQKYAPLLVTVKLAQSINKGQAVYISSANGTNIIVSKASNTTEATSSKTLGLLSISGVTNDIIDVITEGFITGIDTSTATVGDPVWLGTSGNLIYGLSSKPVAPAHLVYIGVVSRVSSTVGEILVKVQNGFELDELHDVNPSLNVTTPVDADKVLIKENSSGLWKSLSWSDLKNNFLNKQVLSIASSTTPTFSVAGFDETYYDITALAGNIASFGANITGTPPNRARLMVSFKDNGTARTLAFSTLFNFSTYLQAPVSTTIGKTLYLDAIYNSTTSKYDVINWQDGY